MLEFKKTEIEANIYGVVHKLRRPSVKEAQDYSAAVKGLEGEEQSMMLLKLLEKCGLPVDVSLAMESEHLVQLVEGLMPSKKK